MDDYEYSDAWKVRKIQILIVTTICFVLGIIIGKRDMDIREGLIVWFFGTWLFETIISSFTPGGLNISKLALVVLAGAITLFFDGLLDGSSRSRIIYIVTGIAFIGMIIALFLVLVILMIEFLILPITTAYLYIRSKEEELYYGY